MNTYSDLSETGLKDLPFFPPLCVSPPVVDDVCQVFGFQVDCVKNFTDGDFSHFGLYGSHIWTFLLTSMAGCVSISYANRFFAWEWRDSMKVTMGLYAIITSMFALLRVTLGVGRPLVLIAALHNLCEWAILFHCAAEDKYGGKMKTSLIRAIIFISTIITVCLMVPDIPISLGVEQLFGMMLDVALPWMFGRKLFYRSEPDEVKDFFLLPFLAHFIHLLFTILPLIFAIFWSRSESILGKFVLEIFINLSVPITHILYILWAFKVDKLMVSKHSETQKETSDPKYQNETRKLPTDYQIKNVDGTLFKSFFISFIPLVLCPILMGFCDEDKFCTKSKVVHQTTSYFITPGLEGPLEDMLARKEIASTASKFNGNIKFVISKSVDDNNRKVIEILDSWATIDFAKKWIDSEHAKFLTSEEVLKIVDGNIRSSGYLSQAVLSPGCRPLEERSFVFHSKQSCNSLWKELSDKSRCNLIPRCIHVAKDEFDLEIFSFSDGRVLKGKRYLGTSISKNIIYDFGNSDDNLLGGFKSDVMLETMSRNVCKVKVRMSIPRKAEGNKDALGPIIDEIKYNASKGLWIQ
mmetsp:Transcript_3940/g.5373  ORF Transcript_3940/g.5373 Transcript_3940/m.5373 type:complete len:579 (+) Transcript_3940:53-1789(+)